MLLSPAIPAVALVFARWGTPESPRWLASQGRIDEANAALQKVFGPTAKLDDIPDDEAKPATLGSLMRGVYLRRMIFISVFWTCSILPIYAIYAFGPAMIDAFGLGEPGQANLGEAGIGLLFLLGCLAATLLANRLNRRTLLIWPFAISTVALLGLGLAGTASTLTIAVLFSVYAVAIGGPTILQWVYPNELFPTEIRATAVGLGTSISRIGAALGTFLTPIGLQTFGIGTTLLIAAAISATGVIVSYFMAPETRNKSLSETSGG
jgi:putative MFS transporter